MKRREWVKNVAATGAVVLGDLAFRPMPGPAFPSVTSERPLTPFQEAGNQIGSGRENRSRLRVKSVQELVTVETKTAIGRGLRFLADRQISAGPFQGAFGSSGYAAGTAVTALAGLAMLCNGSTPFDGPYDSHIRRCTDFLLRNTSDRGYIASPGNRQSNMYGHGYAMLFLSQVYGMSGSLQVEQKLRRAVEMTCQVQNDQGGWRYQPSKQEGDLSITICQIMALRAAHDAGMYVSEEVRDRTLNFVTKSQKKDGSFQYMLRGGRVSLALTAAGVVSLYSAGIYEGESVEKALEWLNIRRPGSGRSSREVSPMNYYYAHYYAVQAMWHAQIHHPDYWNQWYPAIRDELLSRSRKGVWDDARVCKEFATAMACIILQIPFNFVPVFAP